MRIVTIILIMACAACGSPAPGGDAGGPDGAAGVDSVAEALSPTDTTPELEAGAPDTPPDTPPPPDAPPELSPPQDTAPCPGCPAGFCDEDAGVCTWCDEDHPCPGAVQWCRDNECVETLCVPGKMACKDPSTAQECDPEGEAWIEEPCGEGEACAAGVCQPVICVPGETGCDGFLVQECDPAGVGWFKYACPPGFGCYVDECLPIRSNLLVIFDTSSSMWSIGFGDTVPCICPSGCSAKPFPACEDPLCPRSRLGLSKYVFGQFFNAEEIQSVNLVVTHFPMRIKYPPVLECNNLFAMGRGWFGLDIMASDFMTGDDGSHETPDGSWFEDYLYEILAVPFASSWFDPTLEQAQLWVDFDEQVGPTDEPCTANGD
ncbi:MAG: hypothetical protein FJ098_15375, partial [Deltaproteobacteria bacterium]|nr:hypothetical protein [Deltaproteobacteria bacterium]